jgi:hypothetical protein
VDTVLASRKKLVDKIIGKRKEVSVDHLLSNQGKKQKREVSVDHLSTNEKEETESNH